MASKSLVRPSASIAAIAFSCSLSLASGHSTVWIPASAKRSRSDAPMLPEATSTVIDLE